MEKGQAITATIVELDRASVKYPAFNSHHEGYAVILEELEELKLEIFKRIEARDTDLLQRETIQVAAMALRFLIDLC